jgi:hypothetical protein
MANMAEYLRRFAHKPLLVTCVSQQRVQGNLVDMGEDYIILEQGGMPGGSKVFLVPFMAIDSIQLPSLPAQAQQTPPASQQPSEPPPQRGRR